MKRRWRSGGLAIRIRESCDPESSHPVERTTTVGIAGPRNPFIYRLDGGGRMDSGVPLSVQLKRARRKVVQRQKHNRRLGGSRLWPMATSRRPPVFVRISMPAYIGIY